MDMNELTKLLSVLGPVFGVVGAILGILGWLIRSHIEAKNEEIKRLKTECQTREVEVAKYRGEAVECKAERDEAIRRQKEAERSVAPLTAENHNLKQRMPDLERQAAENKALADKHKRDADQTKAEADKNLAAAIEQRTKRKETEATHAKTVTSAKTAIEAAAERVKAAEASTAAALKLRDDADTKAAALQDERDALDAIVTRLEKQLDGILKRDGRHWNAPVPADAPPFVPLATRKMPIISVLNLKGGVGKTTIAANLGGYLGNHMEPGPLKRVLMIDLDHQRSLTQTLLSAGDHKAASLAGRTIQDFLLSGTRTGEDLRAVAEKVSGLTSCWLITNSDPSAVEYGATKSLDDVEMELLSRWLVKPWEGDARFLLRPALHSPAIRQAFDYVLIDCPPRLTTACISALAASDFVLIPTQAEVISIRSVPHLIQRLKSIQNAGVLNHLQILGIVANMVSSEAQNKTSQEFLLLAETEGLAQKLWGKPLKVFKSKLKESDSYASATKSLGEWDKLSLAVSRSLIRGQYKSLVTEIEERINDSIGVAGVPS